MKTAEFQQLVWEFYDEHGRENLPWRRTDDPYAIYISEMMLQQTQAERVTEPYKAWLEQFPTFESVAAASTKEILEAWQGLGYNRRALYIKEAAEIITEKYGGQLPDQRGELMGLPGIGPYTAGALLAFVFGRPVVFVETNIRTVFIHHYFADDESVSDAAIRELVGETLPAENIKEWYWALMDYGSQLKKAVGNLNQKSATYQKQSTFAGSNRQLRSQLTRFILKHEPVSREQLEAEFNDTVATHERMKSVSENLTDLETEGFLTHTEAGYKTSD